jgi:hypothetical protein
MNKAVIVTVSKYKNPSLSYDGWQVDGNQNSKAMYDFMRDQGGLGVDDISVLMDESATRDNIKNRLEWFAKQNKETDTLYFYFSGHGCKMRVSYENKRQERDLSDNDVEMLCCYDFEFRGKDYGGCEGAISDNTLRNIASPCRGRFVCIFDACFSGGMVNAMPIPFDIKARSGRPGEMAVDTIRDVFKAVNNQFPKRREIHLISACEENESAGTAGGCGFFTRYFIMASETAKTFGEYVNKVNDSCRGFGQTAEYHGQDENGLFFS